MLPHFENTTGEGVVSFLPCLTDGPELEADRSRWYHHLLVSGERVFQYGAPCGTCGVTFQKLSSAADRLDDGEAAELLGTLEALPGPEVLRALARVLDPVTYHPLVMEGRTERVAPGDARDYFATDAVRLFGLEPPDYERPLDPGTSYYRFGPSHTLERSGRLSGSHLALVTAVLMPLQDSDRLARDRVEYWKSRSAEGAPLTALAVGIIDGQAPAMNSAEPDYPYEEHFLLTNCIVDGHHRVQAATELGIPVRILSFVAPEASLVAEVDVSAVVVPYVV